MVQNKIQHDIEQLTKLPQREGLTAQGPAVVLHLKL